MIRIGVLGTSSIAERRMIPAIRKESGFQYAGVAFSVREEMGFSGTEADFAPFLIQKKEKAERFRSAFGGVVYESYLALLSDPEINAVYIALPPALHSRWVREALSRGKHVLCEKPFTTREEDTVSLIRLARNRGLAVIENYGFPLHRQMDLIRQYLSDGSLGDLRLVRASFGFPHRDSADFRYDPKLGGGALLDCGGYTLKAATTVLGSDVKVLSARSVVTEGHSVDVFGSAMLTRKDGVCAQVSYGMDQAYRCELEIWGSRGIVTAPRIFTAPDGFAAQVILKQGQEIREQTFPDDQFRQIVRRFEACIRSEEVRNSVLEEILLQSSLTEQVRAFGLSGKPDSRFPTG